MIAKKLLTLSALLMVCAAGRAETFDLGRYGKLTLDIPTGWKAKVNDEGRFGYRIDVKPKAAADALCRFSIIYNAPPDYYTDDGLMKSVGNESRRFAVGSVEQAVNVKRFRLDHGFGYYATFTDASLVNQTPKSGEYKTMSPGMICLSGRLILSVTMYSDNVNGPEAKAMFDMVRSAHYLEPESGGKS